MPSKAECVSTSTCGQFASGVLASVTLRTVACASLDHRPNVDSTCNVVALLRDESSTVFDDSSYASNAVRLGAPSSSALAKR